MVNTKPSIPPLRYITWIKHRTGNYGMYWVRFFKSGKVISSKTFTELQYNGKPEALKAAQLWRDLEMLKLGFSVTHNNLRKYRTNARSNTGITGVTDITRISKLGYVSYEYAACWVQTEDGKRKPRAKHFSYKPDVPGSQERAFKLAKRHRKLMEKLHYTGVQNETW